MNKLPSISEHFVGTFVQNKYLVSYIDYYGSGPFSYVGTPNRSCRLPYLHNSNPSHANFMHECNSQKEFSGSMILE